MMKKLSVLGVSAVALLLSACNAISSIVGVAMDTPEAWTKVQEIISEKVDTNEWKLVSVEMSQESGRGKELNNDLYYCSVVMVDRSGSAWSQVFFLEGAVGNLTPYRENTDFSATPALNVKSISPEKYAKQIEDAKKIILKEDYKFECVASYSIDNTEAEGRSKCRFVLHVTEKNPKTVSNAGRTVTEYYEIPFVVDEQGTVSLNIE